MELHDSLHFITVVLKWYVLSLLLGALIKHALIFYLQVKYFLNN
jgi:hypothetical protein